MPDQLAARRNLVKRATEELNIPHAQAMKMKSAEIIAQLEGNTMSDVVEETPVPTPVEPVGGENADPEAPYGRKADGTPKAKPGRKSGVSNGAPRVNAPTRRSRKAGTSTRANAAVDYRPGISGLLQIPAFALVSAGRFKPELEYDGIAIATHTPAIAEAVNQLALEEPRVAAVLDKVLTIGPYGALLGAFVPLAAQVAVNHKKLPAGTMGAVEPETLKASFAPTE